MLWKFCLRRTKTIDKHDLSILQSPVWSAFVFEMHRSKHAFVCFGYVCLCFGCVWLRFKRAFGLFFGSWANLIQIHSNNLLKTLLPSNKFLKAPVTPVTLYLQTTLYPPSKHPYTFWKPQAALHYLSTTFGKPLLPPHTWCTWLSLSKDYELDSLHITKLQIQITRS